MKYFWTPDSIGLNRDIERHKAEQKNLEDKIAEIEAQPDNPQKKGTYKPIDIYSINCYNPKQRLYLN